MTPELLRLSDGTQRAWRRICAQFQSTGRYPATRGGARSVALACEGSAPDVAALCGYPHRQASAPAKRIAEFLHGKEGRK